MAHLAGVQRTGAAGGRVCAPIWHRAHQVARRRRLLEPVQRALLRRATRRPRDVVRAMGRHGTDAAHPRPRPILQADLPQPRIGVAPTPLAAAAIAELEAAGVDTVIGTTV